MTETERFWSKVDKSGDCWVWTGETNNQGYGRFAVWGPKGRRTRHLAHRYVLATMGRLEPSLLVLHACDNPPCVNPDHLSQGTQADNMRDAREKDRIDLSGLRLAYSRSDRSAVQKKTTTAPLKEAPAC